MTQQRTTQQGTTQQSTTQQSGHASARSIMIGGREVGPDAVPFIIAEMSGNHDGDLDKALAIVRVAAEAGAHAIKLQTYTAETITIDADTPDFRISSGHELWADRRLYDLYEEAHTPWDWHAPIFELAGELGLLAFSSPFDPTAVAFLESLDVPCYKIASSEIVDLPLIRLAAGTGKPIIISTGMASVGEIDAAVKAARSTGNEPDHRALVHRRLPGRPGRLQPAGHPRPGGHLQHPGRSVRPHHGHRRGGRSGCSGCLCHREARDHLA